MIDKIKLRKLYESIVLVEDLNFPKEVIVQGDRRVGKYKVRLLNQVKKSINHPGYEDELLFTAKIIKLINNRYDFQIGDYVYVIFQDDDFASGVIEPFAEDDFGPVQRNL